MGFIRISLHPVGTECIPMGKSPCSQRSIQRRRKNIPSFGMLCISVVCFISLVLSLSEMLPNLELSYFQLMVAGVPGHRFPIAPSPVEEASG